MSLVSIIRGTNLCIELGTIAAVENSGLDVRDGLIDSPDAPLEQAY